MTLRDFAGITLKTALDDGFDAYLPTLAFLDTDEIFVVSGIPAEVDPREAIQKVVRRGEHHLRPFFFGVRSGPGQITVGLHRPGRPAEFLLITSHGDGAATREIGACPWWTLDEAGN